EVAASILLAFVRERIDALDDETVKAIADLADQWGKSDVLPEQACALLSELRKSNDTDFIRVLGGWIPQLFANLPIECVKLIATQFETLP
ncbi:hypothetical protein O6461_25010, partial [Salmonella enterica subsp. enterica]